MRNKRTYQVTFIVIKQKNNNVLTLIVMPIYDLDTLTNIYKDFTVSQIVLFS